MSIDPSENSSGKVFGGVEGVTLPADIARQVDIRRAKNPLRSLHHHAYRCRDSEETRIFYEDVMGLPLIQTVIQNRDFEPEKSNFCHIFFELGDGSALAFFECIGGGVTRDFTADTGFDHHVAIWAETDEVIEDYKRRLDAAGVAYSYIDHQMYHSLYFTDPNGLNLEITTGVSFTQEQERKMGTVAHKELALWTASTEARKPAHAS